MACGNGRGLSGRLIVVVEQDMFALPTYYLPFLQIGIWAWAGEVWLRGVSCSQPHHCLFHFIMS